MDTFEFEFVVLNERCSGEDEELLVPMDLKITETKEDLIIPKVPLKKKETTLQRKIRLEKAKLKRLEKRSTESPAEREKRLRRERERRAEQIKKETPEQRKLRLDKANLRQAKFRNSESQEQREARLKKVREHISKLRKTKTTEQVAQIPQKEKLDSPHHEIKIEINDE